MSRRRRRQRGFAMVTVLMLTMMVMLTATMVLLPSFMGRSASIHSGAMMTAGNLADAGLDFGLASLNTTVPTGTSATLTTLPTCFTTSTATPNTWTYSDSTNSNFFRNNFDKTIPVITVRIPAAVPVPGGPGVAADYRIVRSEATILGAQKRVEAIVRIRSTLVDNPISPFPRAITARGDINPNGSNGTLRTDSYDSANGVYGGGNLGTNGGVHTNGSVIDGGVYKGNVSAVGSIDSGVSVLGSGNVINPGAEAQDIPDGPAAPVAGIVNMPASTPSILTPPAGTTYNLGAVSISGNATNVLTLMPGNYIMSSLRTVGQATIEIGGSGQVNIWVTGDIDIAGNGIVNSSALPTNLRMMETSSTATVSEAGNGNFYGVIQAPNNDVTVGGNGQFFGAVVAGTFTFNGNNSEVHYDDAVGRAFSANSTQSRPSEWQTLAINVLDKNN